MEVIFFETTIGMLSLFATSAALVASFTAIRFKLEDSDTYPFFRFSQNISYNKNIAESSKFKNYRYLCNNNKVTPKLLTSNSGKILTTNRIF